MNLRINSELSCKEFKVSEAETNILMKNVPISCLHSRDAVKFHLKHMMKRWEEEGKETD